MPFRLLNAWIVTILGMLLGFLVWQAYFQISLPDWLIHFIINRESMDFFLSILGTQEKAERCLIVLIMLARSAPAGMVIGGVAGLILTKINFKRLFVYSTLIWPLWLFMSSLVSILAYQEELSIATTYTKWLWERRSEQLWAQFAMYSVFFIVMFAVSHQMMRVFKNSSPLCSGALQKHEPPVS